MYRVINVALRQEIYDKLRNKGKFGESFSELISRLLDGLDENGRPEGYRI